MIESLLRNMPSEYIPDKWLIIKFKWGYKVLGTWRGGFADGDHWRMNSGISNIEELDNFYLIHGFSGSIYKCFKNNYGFSSLSMGIVSQIMEADADAEVLKDTSGIMELQYES